QPLPEGIVSLDVSWPETGTPVMSMADGDAPTAFQVQQFAVSFIGAEAVSPVGLERYASTFEDQRGELDQWHSDEPSFEVVAYEGLYEGVDLRTRGTDSNVQYEFFVAPGTDHSQIHVAYQGVAGLS